MKEGHGHPYQWCVPVHITCRDYEVSIFVQMWSKINRKLMCQVKFNENIFTLNCFLELYTIFFSLPVVCWTYNQNIVEYRTCYIITHNRPQGLGLAFNMLLGETTSQKNGVEYWALPGSNSLWRPWTLDFKPR